MNGMGMGMMLGMGLIFLIVLGLAVVGIVSLARDNESSKRLPAPESPEELLRRRFASGELDEDEYERRRAGLRE
ncbi:SHOCT domain-containing protein [Nocardioides sp.]|mgnify:CR=1 FL=1|uniref:SHOCT domain-containing protein n=1 Tax=Nocardioides sp. TaxID=35761 RepID=UPI002390FFD7|nr:SHOCT domain-containing protein [Nocardioides sp.]MDE0777428.1 SHOCT domain-containing protein [Nocardioides sp.]